MKRDRGGLDRDSARTSSIRFLEFRLDSANQCLWRRADSGEEARVALTPKAFDVLGYLVERAGRLVSHDELLDDLWPRAYVQPEVLKHQVLELRKVLGDDAKHPRYIETLSRRGYRFIASIGGEIEEAPTAEVGSAQLLLVGRNEAFTELHDGLARASQGQRQIAFVTGEPGIGKTALLDEFQHQAITEVPGLRIARGQCVEAYGGQEAYYPLLEALGQLCRGPGGDEIVKTLAAQAPTWLAQFPALLKSEYRQSLQREIQGGTRERMPREITEALESITAERALLIVLEDLQWVDAATVDVLSALARRRSLARLMLIGSVSTCNSTLVGHPLTALKSDLLIHRLCREVPLGPISEADVAQFVGLGSPDPSPATELAKLIHRHCGGNPLFMIATLEHMSSRGLVSREGGRWRLTGPAERIELGVPDGLRRLIEARIERLSADERKLLEVASVTGAAFFATASARAANLSPEYFEDLCDSLWRRKQVVRFTGVHRFPDGSVSARYEFLHTVYRDILYGRLPSARRDRLHARIGHLLEELYGGCSGEIAAELAHHFELGRDWARAATYLQQAADTANRRQVRSEASALLRRALELTRKLPDAQRAALENGILEKLAAISTAAHDDTASRDKRALETHHAVSEQMVGLHFAG
jgi:predicted ATPase/DNA-binding winged helix-turn-helix (wHTH) protein